MKKIYNEQKEKGRFYTKKDIVIFMLDLINYVDEVDISNKSILDPSFGDGAFLKIIIKRLLNNYINMHTSFKGIVDDLKDCIRGVEIDKISFKKFKLECEDMLYSYGLDKEKVINLLDNWLVNEDFLLWETDIKFDYIIGNPPYIRQELIEKEKIKLYKKKYKTIYDRADIYIPFIEKGLNILNNNGNLSYICTDRFLRNNYGKKIRAYIKEKYALKLFIDMHKTSPFKESVLAYPCIFILGNQDEEVKVKTVVMNDISKVSINETKQFYTTGEIRSINKNTLFRYTELPDKDSPWIFESSEAMSILNKIENQYNTIECTGDDVKVSIGVATGADKIYIVKGDIDIEKDRLVPILLSKDVSSGKIKWSENYVINTFLDNEHLIDLNNYPKLQNYFKTNEHVIKNRNVAKRNKEKWYRTIDKIHEGVLKQPKILIPDINGKNIMVIDEGNYYPHHNLYYILPGKWDVEILRAILASTITKFFIWMYSTRMKGGYVRYQAQYLRKIRLPKLEDIKDIEELRRPELIDNLDELDIIVSKIYKLSKDELDVIYEVLR